MPNIEDRWLWVIDEELVQTPIAANDAVATTAKKRGVGNAALVKAIGFRHAGETDAALEVLGEAIEKNGSVPDLFFVRGHLLFERGDYPGAQASYETALRMSPQSKLGIFNIAVCLERQGRFEEANAGFRKAWDADRSFVAARFAQGICLLHLNQAGPALEAFEECLSAQAGEWKALFGKAAALQLLGRLEEAERAYESVAEGDLQNTEVLGNLIACVVARGDEGKAREYSERLLRLHPGSSIALEALVSTAVARGDFTAAAQYGAELIKSDPNSATGWFNFGLAQENLHQTAEAEAAYRRVIELDAANTAARVNLGVLLAGRSEHQEARELFDSAVQADPGSDLAHWNRALHLEKTGNYKEAEGAYASVAPGGVHHKDAWLRLGHLRMERKDWAGAVEVLRVCAQGENGGEEAAFRFALAQWRSGDRSGAEKTLQHLVAVDPNHAEGWRLLCCVAVENGDYIQGAEAHEKLAALGVHDAALAYNLGVLLQGAGLHEEAARFYQAALRQRPELGEALLNLGHVWNTLGNEEDAQRCWSAVAEQHPALAAEYFQ